MEAFEWFGGGVFSTLILVLYVATEYPEKFERFISIIMKILSYISKNAERKRITTYINSRIEMYRKNIERAVPGTLPRSFRVEFVDLDNPEIYLQGELLILKMRKHTNDSKNLALAATYYSSKGVLPYAKKYIHKNVFRSIEFNVAKGIVRSDEIATEIVRELYSDCLTDENIAHCIRLCEEISDCGYLTRILIPEYQRFNSYYPNEPKTGMSRESEEFFGKVYGVVSRKQGDDKISDFGSYQGRYIKAIIVPVVALERRSEGALPHFQYIENKVINGVEDVYVVAAGRGNLKFAKDLVFLLEKSSSLNLERIQSGEYQGIYRGRNERLLCTHLRKIQ